MNLPVQNVRVHLVDEGTGIPTLLIHGNPATSELWTGVIEHLKRQYRCLAPDLPGYGRSFAPPEFDWSLRHMAQFIDDLLTAIPISEPVNVDPHCPHTHLCALGRA